MYEIFFSWSLHVSERSTDISITPDLVFSLGGKDSIWGAADGDSDCGSDEWTSGVSARTGVMVENIGEEDGRDAWGSMPTTCQSLRWSDADNEYSEPLVACYSLASFKVITQKCEIWRTIATHFLYYNISGKYAHRKLFHLHGNFWVDIPNNYEKQRFYRIAI